ncbi:MAG: rhodanese-like domain-containing protein [Clostridium sp.]
MIDRIDLKNILEKENYTIIDIRNSNSFNGWRLDGEILEGHIKGAVNIRNEEEIISFSKQKRNILICYSDEKYLSRINKIRKLDNVIFFDMKLLEKEDKDIMEYYKNYKLLVPPTYILENNDIKIFHVGYGMEDETSIKGHIDGSIYLNTDELEPPPNWTIGDKKILEKVEKKYGLRDNKTVVLTAWDQMAAFRVAYIFEYMGIKDVRVLNGGLKYYEKLGYPLVKEKTIIKKQKVFKNKLSIKNDILISTEEVKKNIDEKIFELVDNRTFEEFSGKISGYDYYDRAARIPGAKFGHAGLKGPHSLEYYRNKDGTMRSKDEIEKLWIDVDTTKKLVFMCGSGWRASEVYFYAKVIGYEEIGIYSDGWIGWSSDWDNPILKE